MQEAILKQRYPPGVEGLPEMLSGHRRPTIIHNFFPHQLLKGGGAMSTPPKPANVIRMEGKSHRTKKELAGRERAERELLTGKALSESRAVKENELAHREYLRIKKLLKSIGKDDDLYGAVINRYCLLQAECQEFQAKREQVYGQMQKLEEGYGDFKDQNSLVAYFKMQTDMQKSLLALDRQVQAKRKMLLDLEKENIMTIAAALRSVPKKPSEKKSALMEALASGD